MRKITILFSLVTVLILLALLLPLSLLTAAKAAANTDGSIQFQENILPPSIPLEAASLAPDGFGYTYQDNDEADGPTYNFIDISSSGTPLNLADDQSITITLAYNFVYYGGSSNQLLVGNNGGVIFNPSSTAKVFPNNACPFDSNSTNNIIAPWWDDWGGEGNVYSQTFGSTPNRYTVIQWDQKVHYGDTGSTPVTFELILYETSNVILFQYLNTDTGTKFANGADGTFGIRGASTANTLPYEACNSAVLTDTLAIRFQHSSLTIVKDTVNPDTSTDVFTFTGSSPISSSFYLSDGGSASSTESFNLLPGGYTVTEDTPPTDWGLSNLVCQSTLDNTSGFTGPVSSISSDLGTRTANISSLAPGDQVSCTFTNSQLGRIIIQKSTDPASDSQVFTFTSSITGGSLFTLTTNPGPISQTFANLTPGSYSVVEDDPDSLGWNLTDLTCNDPIGGDSSVVTSTRTANINVSAGETVTCYFTNAKRGTIHIQKDAVPDNAQLFSFSATVPATPTFTLSDGGSASNVEDFSLLPGSYRFTEGTLPSGWQFTDLACAVGGSGSTAITGTGAVTVSLAAGEDVTCIFTNTKLATIVVEKVTDPSGDTTLFDFTTTGLVTPTFTLADGGRQFFYNLLPGSGYAVAETTPVTWTLVSSTCTGVGNTPDAITLNASDTVTCTFTNRAKPSTLIVEKVTDPASASQIFTVTTSIPATPTFTLSTGSGPVSQTFTITPGTYTLSEQTLPDWELTDSACSNGSALSSVKLEAGETVTCILTNTQKAALSVYKNTVPAGDTQTFNFGLTGGPGPVALGFNLVAATQPYTTIYVRSGSVPYVLTETASLLSSGWDLTDTSCTSGSIDNLPLTNPGEAITCTFTNTKRGKIVVEKITAPSSDTTTPFTFTTTGLSPATFNLTGGGEVVFDNLPLTATYSVSETELPTGWSLTDTSCNSSLGSGVTPDSITLSAGEVVTCTFTNQAADGTLIVQKITDPSSDDQVFDFSTNITGVSSFTLTTNPGPISRTFVISPGTAYQVSETSLTGWDTTGATCDNGSAPTSFNVNPNETVTCTFTNTKRGEIVVDKVTSPAGMSDSFGFSLTGGPDSLNRTFSLTDTTAPYQSGFIKPGSYSLTETATSAVGFTVTTSCSDGSLVDNIDLSAGEAITCTVTNTIRPSTLTIIKDAGGQSQNFNFELSQNNTILQTFTLNDGSSTTRTTGPMSLLRGNYTVGEFASPSPWSLLAIACDDPSGGTTWSSTDGQADIALAAGDDVTCIFTNTRTTSVGSITIVKSAVPTGTQTFNFSGSLGSFSLTDTGTSLNYQIFNSLTPQTYTVTEAAVSGWNLTNLTCNDPDNGSSVNSGGRTATIDLDGGENITCIFTNTSTSVPTGSITIVKSAVPTGTQSFGFTGGLGAFSLVDDGTSANRQRVFSSLTPGSYLVTETTVSGWNLTGLICNDTDSTGSTTSRAATINLQSGENVICTFTNTAVVSNPSTLYLPIIMKSFTQKLYPDLTITDFTISGSDPDRVVTIVVQNTGSVSTDEGFWVDFYVNPTSLPDDSTLGGDRRWNHLGSTQGIAWAVPALEAGQSATLTSNGSGGLAPTPAQTVWSGSLPSGTNNLYTFADSYSQSSNTYVAIQESNEANNLASQTVVVSAEAGLEPTDLSAPTQLPPRSTP